MRDIVSVEKRIEKLKNTARLGDKHSKKEMAVLDFIYHKMNKGVGAAFLTGFYTAQSEECEVYLKIDSDNQHLPYYLYEIIPYILNLPSYELFLLKGSRYFSQRTSFHVPSRPDH